MSKSWKEGGMHHVVYISCNKGFEFVVIPFWVRNVEAV